MARRLPKLHSYGRGWWNDPQVGCGHRHLLIYNVGTKWANVFYWPTLTNRRVLKSALPTITKPLPTAPLPKLIAAKTKEFDRLNVGYPKVLVSNLLKALKKNKGKPLEGDK